MIGDEVMQCVLAALRTAVIQLGLHDLLLKLGKPTARTHALRDYGLALGNGGDVAHADFTTLSLGLAGFLLR